MYPQVQQLLHRIIQGKISDIMCEVHMENTDGERAGMLETESNERFTRFPKQFAKPNEVMLTNTVVK